MSTEDKGLRKDLGLIAAMAIVVGMVIGSGIFMKPAKVIVAAGDSTMALLAWTLGGVITLAGGLTVAELGACIPRTGGLYAYLDEVYGKFWGYLFGWMQTVIYGPATIGALGLYFAVLVIPFFGLSESLKMPIAIIAVLLLSAVNCIGSKYGGMIQAVATAGKLIPIAMIAILGIFKGNGNLTSIFGVASGAAQSAGMGAAILATLWAYDGWINVGNVAGEMKNPAKQLPQAIIFGLIIVMAAYLSVNVAMLHVIPAPEVVKLGQQAAPAVSNILLGEIGGRILGVGIIISIFGALNGFVLTGPRVPYAMATQGQLPASSFLSKVSPKFGTPINATILQAALTILLMTLGDPDRLTDIAVFMIWIFYFLAFVGVIIWRKKAPDLERPYRVPLYPVIPAIAILGAVYIIISTIMGSPMDSMSAIGLTLVGIPIYMWLKKQSGSKAA